MKKIFLNCQDGDKIRVSFEYDEERVAFEDVVTRLCILYDCHCKHSKPLPFETKWTEEDDSTDVLTIRGLFKTTLEYQIAEEKLDDLRKVFSHADVLNIIAKDEVIFICHDPSER